MPNRRPNSSPTLLRLNHFPPRTFFFHPFSPLINYWVKFSIRVWSDILMLAVCSYHVTYAFQSESTLYSCVNVTDILARSRREIWSLSDWNWTWTHNHIVHKRTLNHLAKPASLAKWLSVRLWTKRWVRVQLQSLMLTVLQVHTNKPTQCFVL